MNKIPKVIHYSWLSGNDLPERLHGCVESWKRIMPDYRLEFWDIDRVRSEMGEVPWIEKCLEEKLWQFASDYVRYYLLYKYGGIWLDTDVRAVRSFDLLLGNRGFSAVEFWEKVYLRDAENNGGIEILAAVIGAEPGHPYIKDCLDWYAGQRFNKKISLFSFTSPKVMVRRAVGHGFRYEDFRKEQVLDGDFHIYPANYFPTQGSMKDIPVDENTYAIHLVTGGWWEQGFENLHHPYTEWRLLTVKYFKDLWKRSFSRTFKKYEKEKYTM